MKSEIIKIAERLTRISEELMKYAKIGYIKGAVVEEWMEKALKKAIREEDKEVMDILEDLFYELQLNRFIEKDFPALVWNWYTDFENVSEYIDFAKNFMADPWGFMVREVVREMKLFPLPTEERIMELRRWYGEDWKKGIAEQIVDEWSLEEVVEFLAPHLLKTPREKLIEYFESEVYPYKFRLFRDWLKDLDEVIFTLEAMPEFIEKLKPLLEKYKEEK